jgi:hypothetical protein
MSHVNDLVKDLLRCQANYAVLDKENDRLREIEEAANELIKYLRRGSVAAPEPIFGLICRLNGAVERSEKAKAKQWRKNK